MAKRATALKGPYQAYNRKERGGFDEELSRVAYEQMKKLSFSHMFTGKSHEPGVLLADKLVRMAPFAASRAFFGNSGSDANDTQIKLVRYYNKIGRAHV